MYGTSNLTKTVENYTFFSKSKTDSVTDILLDLPQLPYVIVDKKKFVYIYMYQIFSGAKEDIWNPLRYLRF